jgi:GTP-binding protein
LVERPRILVINKQELIQEEDLDAIVTALTDASGSTPLLISAAMSRGLNHLLDRVWSDLGI